MNESEEVQKWASIKVRTGKDDDSDECCGNTGLKYDHTYTILDATTVKLANNYTDIIVLMRNPSGKNCKGINWNGDWSEFDDLWTKDTKR